MLEYQWFSRDLQGRIINQSTYDSNMSRVVGEATAPELLELPGVLRLFCKRFCYSSICPTNTQKHTDIPTFLRPLEKHKNEQKASGIPTFQLFRDF